MNQATSRRLRARMLLLLVPLLIASAPSTPPPPSAAAPAPVPGQPHHLVFVNLPFEFIIGQCIPFGVEVRDYLEAKVQAPAPIQVNLSGTLMSGVFHGPPGCGSPEVDFVTIPAGATGQQVWYKPPLLGGVILTASDSSATLDPAMSRPLSVVNSLTNELQLEPPSTTVKAGDTVRVTVTARNLVGVASGYSGTVHFSTAASGVTLPPDYTFDPAVDNGTKTFLVTFNNAGEVDLLIEDAHNTQIQADSARVSVQAAAAASFRLDGFRTDVQAGVPVTFTLVPLDSNGNPTTSKAQLRFLSDDTLAELPPDTPTSSTIDLPAQFTVTFRSPSSTPRSFKVADVSTIPNIALTTSVLVQAGAPEHVKLSTDSAEVPVGCGNGTVKLAAFDSQNIPASAAVIVTLCKDVNRLPTSATFVSSTLGSYTLEGPCITGELRGTAEVVWTNQVEEEVKFDVTSGLRSENSISITWSGAPVLSSTESTLELVEPSTTQPPELQTYSAPRTVKLTLRDSCKRAMPLPAGQPPSFAANAPLAVSSAQQDPASTHVWTASVRLSSCPADRTVPLAIWPIVNNEPWKGASTTQRVAPKCSAPLKINLLSSADSLWVEPGATTEFELEVSNTVDVPVPDAILMADVEGLTVIKATLDGEPLAARKDGFALPELRKDAPLKVKVKVQATTQEQAMLAMVWCEDLGANWLSSQTPVSLNADKLGVDVGCGCHTATPAGQLLPWLLLLLAGSRPWVRLRRLRRGERTEH